MFFLRYGIAFVLLFCTISSYPQFSESAYDSLPIVQKYRHTIPQPSTIRNYLLTLHRWMHWTTATGTLSSAALTTLASAQYLAQGQAYIKPGKLLLTTGALSLACCWSYFVKEQLITANIGKVSIIGDLRHSTVYRQAFKKVFQDDTIAAIIVMIESGGGLVAVAQPLTEEILLLKKQYPKPVIVYSETACLSSAYYIAVAIADHFIGTKYGSYGSIGVFLHYEQLRFDKYLQEKGIYYEIFKGGKFKHMPNQYEETPEALKNDLQQKVDRIYQDFVDHVKRYRPQLAERDTKEWAEGRKFLGIEAIDLGMIDQLGSYTDVETLAKYLTGSQLLHIINT